MLLESFPAPIPTPTCALRSRAASPASGSGRQGRSPADSAPGNSNCSISCVVYFYRANNWYILNPIGNTHEYHRDVWQTTWALEVAVSRDSRNLLSSPCSSDTRACTRRSRLPFKNVLFHFQPGGNHNYIQYSAFSDRQLCLMIEPWWPLQPVKAAGVL